MTRAQLEHIIRAAARITGEKRLILIGSQAILGQFPDAPEPLLRSNEADIYAPDRPDRSELITGAIGPGSQFDRTFRYHGDGVTPTTATLPKGWEERLFPICNTNTDGATGWCLEVHDIAIAKYFANREKDRRYTKDLWKHRLIEARTLEQRLRDTPLGDEDRERMRAAARRDQTEAQGSPQENGKPNPP